LHLHDLYLKKVVKLIKAVKNTSISLEGKWAELLADQFELPYMESLMLYLAAERKHGKRIFPPDDSIFNALNYTDFDDVKVVIIGQDPYHGFNQAHGFCFSVETNVAIPPSLKNIYQELNQDLGMPIPRHGNLTSWADQGVLLLNAVLTVEASKAGAHQGKGWEIFTDRVIELLNIKSCNVVFLLWGSYAQKKGKLIDRSKHYVLEGPHPSPLSAYRGFFGCKHFSKANQYLAECNKSPINWASVSEKPNNLIQMPLV
jgi:uracil-DNA glycosylase